MKIIHGVPRDLLYADPGFVHPEKVLMLSEHKSFFQLLRPFNTLAMGEFPHFKKLKWARFWQNTYNNQGSH
jgi:hypothetical protein